MNKSIVYKGKLKKVKFAPLWNQLTIFVVPIFWDKMRYMNVFISFNVIDLTVFLRTGSAGLPFFSKYSDTILPSSK